MPDQSKPVILHLVTWYPTNENHVEGIFIQRHIELLAADKDYQHVVIRKNIKPVSALQHLKYMLGFFEEERIGSMNMISIPDQSTLYKKYIWRYQTIIEHSILNRLVKRYQPKLLHLHVVYGFAKEALYLKEVKGLPFIISEHMGPFPFEWMQDKESVIKKPVQEASAVIAVSKAQANQIYTYTGVTAVVIPNVVDEDVFRFEERNTDAASAESKGYQLVFAGIYTKAKGVDYLLSVFPDFLRTYPNSTLHLAGTARDERMEELNTLMQKTGIENSVQFHGRLSPADLSKLYQRSDFYVCSSQWESFGLSALEALFTGLPLLSTNCGGVNDFITSENGVLIENDQQGLTLLNGLLYMAEQLPSFNRKAIAIKVREKFSNRVIQESYLKIYKQVMQSADSLSAD